MYYLELFVIYESYYFYTMCTMCTKKLFNYHVTQKAGYECKYEHQYKYGNLH